MFLLGHSTENGTDRCYKFATINIVEADRRFTLLTLPVGQFDRKEDILAKLIEYAKRRIKIGGYIWIGVSFPQSAFKRSINIMRIS